MTLAYCLKQLHTTGSFILDHSDDPGDLRLRKRLTTYVNQNRRTLEVLAETGYTLHIRKKGRAR